MVNIVIVFDKYVLVSNFKFQDVHLDITDLNINKTRNGTSVVCIRPVCSIRSGKWGLNRITIGLYYMYRQMNSILELTSGFGDIFYLLAWVNILNIHLIEQQCNIESP